MYPLHRICNVDKDSTWRNVDLNAHADGSKFPKDKPNPLLDPVTCEVWVNQIARKKSVDYTYGGYMENRSTLWRGHYMKDFNHLGIDINVPEGTAIFCPLPFRMIELFRNGDQNGGWGGRLTVETQSGIVVFAHIDFDADIINHWDGQWQPPGRVGFVASPETNGGWFPHLHLQGLASEKLLKGLDGYGKLNKSTKKNYPNPLDILLAFNNAK